MTFHRLSDDRTKIMLQLDAEPDGVIETVGAAAGVLGRRTKGDLERFKDLIESRGRASGGFRERIAAPGSGPDGPSTPAGDLG